MLVQCAIAEPTSYRQSQQHSDAQFWQKACEEEMEAHRVNGTWQIIKLPLRSVQLAPDGS